MNVFGLILAFIQMPAAHTLNSIDDLLNEVSHTYVQWLALYFCIARIGKYSSFPQLYSTVERPP